MSNCLFSSCLKNRWLRLMVSIGLAFICAWLMLFLPLSQMTGLLTPWEARPALAVGGITVTKTANVTTTYQGGLAYPSSFQPGEIEYTIIVTNNTGSTITPSFYISDTIPAGTVCTSVSNNSNLNWTTPLPTCQSSGIAEFNMASGSWANGAAITLSFIVKPDGSYTQSQVVDDGIYTVTNSTITLHHPGGFFGGGNPQNETGINVPTLVKAPVWDITKAVPVTVTAGGVVNYNLNIANSGVYSINPNVTNGFPFTNNSVVTITENLPPGVISGVVTATHLQSVGLGYTSISANMVTWVITNPKLYLEPGSTFTHPLIITYTTFATLPNNYAIVNNLYSVQGGDNVYWPGIGTPVTTTVVNTATCFATHDNGSTVYSSNDAQAVRDAVAVVSATGTVKVAGYCAGVSGGEVVNITKAITLTGGYTVGNWSTYNGSDIASLDALGGGRVIYATAEATLNNLKVQHGYITGANGGGIFANQPMTLTNVMVYSNVATGGGIGGGAYFNASAIAIGTTFDNNNAEEGGGAYFSNLATVTGLTFTNNNANAHGGGAYFSNHATVSNTNFTNNSANTNGGGAQFLNTANVTGTTFISNTSTYGGGAYFVTTVYVTGTTFQNNRANSGNGGGAYFNGTTTIITGTFRDNSATNYGGGAYITNTAMITNTAFINNTSGWGGGIYHYNGVMTLTNMLMARNTATSYGGAMYLNNAGASEVHLRHLTIVGPISTSNAAIHVQGGFAYITNTIITSYSIGINKVSSIASENYNLFSNTTNFSGTITHGANSITNTPAFYDTNAYTLTAASAAIDKGFDLGITPDFEGQPRPHGSGVDIGYDESPYTLAYNCYATPNDGSNVYSSTDASAVQQAVDSNTGNTVKVAGYCAGVQVRASLTQTVYLSRTITLEGGYAITNWLTPYPFTQTTTLDALGGGRVAYIPSGISITMTNITLTNGRIDGNGGGIYNGGKSLVLLTNTIVISNATINNGSNRGGGIHLITNSSTVINGGQIISNSSEGGGGVNLSGGQLTFSAGLIAQNTATLNDGGGININNSAQVTITGNSQIYHNISNNHGGGINLNNTAQVILMGNGQILSNTTMISGNGGGVNITGGQFLLMGNGQILSNTANYGGGGIATSASGAVFTYTSGTVAYNQAAYGGGIYLNNGTSVVTGGRILTNAATVNGGAIYQHAGGITITNSCIVSNSSTAVYRGNGVTPLVATGNWWGAFDGPAPTGSGDSISGVVNASGYLGTAIPGCPTINNNTPNLSIIKTANPITVAVGNMVTYTLAFSNVGSGTATNASITDTFPPNIINPNIISSGLAITQTTGYPNFTWSLAPMSSGMGGIITITGLVPMTSGLVLVTNNVQITGTGDITTNNNTATSTISVTAGACYANLNGTIYNSTDASALQAAVSAASSGNTVKVAGKCEGVQTISGFTQTVLITKNITLQGGYTAANWSTPSLANVTILDALGSGRVISTNVLVTLNGLKVQNGNTAQDGGGIYTNQAITLTNMTVFSNITQNGHGGGLYVNGGLAQVISSTFRNNGTITSATSGGGVYFGNNASITQTLFEGNFGPIHGGGAYFNKPTYIISSTFQNNQTTPFGYGGGAYFNDSADIATTQFINNRAQSGGGILHYNYAMTLTNVLMARNSATSTGAAFHNSSGTSNTVHIRHTTIVSPTLAPFEAIYNSGSGAIYITNSIIASHTIGIHNTTGIVTENYNLYAHNTQNVSGTLTGLNSISDTVAFFNTTNYTLTAASAAIDVGVYLGITTDFEGQTRPQGNGVDMGYDESLYSNTPDLWISKVVTPTTAAPGSTITYILNFSNTGMGIAKNVTITDIIPAGITPISSDHSTAPVTPTAGISYAWTTPVLGPGQGGTITLMGQVAATATGIITNVATITATNEISPNNNSAMAALTVTGLADVMITKNVTPQAVFVGDMVTYTIYFSNVGSIPSNITITDVIPSQLISVSRTHTHTAISATGTLPTYQWQLNNLGVGQGYTITVRGLVATAGMFSNVITITANNDLNMANNVATATVTALTKTTFIVNSNDDVDYGTCSTFHCSLREAINAANNNPLVTNTILFNLPLSNTIITPASALPIIKNPTIIDGLSQPGSDCNTGNLRVELNGTAAGPNTNGLELVGGNSLIRGLVLHHFNGSGMLIRGDDNQISCNFIRINGQRGLYINNGSRNTIISNTITLNQFAGIRIAGNATGNHVSQNSIFINRALGLNLNSLSDGNVTLNDPTDGDSGPNELQNFPVLLQAVYSNGNIQVMGQLNSLSNTNYTLEFFANSACDPSGSGGLSGYGEGERYLDNQVVTTDGLGEVSFTANLSGGVGDIITVNATDSNGNTSEFGRCITVQLPTDLQISKTVDPMIALVGNLITYTLEYTNQSGVTATQVVINDILPDELSGSSYVISTNSYTEQGGSSYIWQLGDLLPYSSGFIIITATVIDQGNPEIINTAMISSTTPDATPDDNVSVVTTTMLFPTAELSLSKTVTPSVAMAGDWLTYTIIFSNNGLGVATDVTIEDSLPVGLINQSYTNEGAPIMLTGAFDYQWDVADLAPNEGGIITITAQINPNIATNMTLANEATIATTALENDMNDNVVTATMNATAFPLFNFSQATYMATEGGNAVMITVTLSAPFNRTTSVDYATTNGTANNGADYTAVLGTLTFAPGTTSQSFGIPLLEDNMVEGNETVQLSLNQATGGARLGLVYTASLIIADNDTAGIVISPTALNVSEGGTGTRYHLTLRSQPTTNVTITLTALQEQLLLTPTTLIFTPINWNFSQTVTVMATDDSLVESLHQDSIRHTVTSGDINYNNLSITDIPVTITDNDFPPTTLTLNHGNPTVVGQAIPFTITRLGGQGVYSYTWDWGDGLMTATGAQNTVNHIYTITGSYTVIVTATNGLEVVTATITVNITPQPMTDLLRVIHTLSQSSTQLGDFITYRIMLLNVSNITAHNVYLTHTWPSSAGQPIFNGFSDSQALRLAVLQMAAISAEPCTLQGAELRCFIATLPAGSRATINLMLSPRLAGSSWVSQVEAYAEETDPNTANNTAQTLLEVTTLLRAAETTPSHISRHIYLPILVKQ